MVRPEDIVRVELTVEQRILARYYAKLTEFCGMSNIREREDRIAHLEIDEFAGIGIGEMAGNKHFYSVSHYIRSRDLRNENPREGDGGCDTLDYKIDYKASRCASSRMLNYHLLVRPREWHPDHTYVRILIDTFGVTDVPQLVRTGAFEIYLIGWASTDMLPARPATNGMFKGAYVLPNRELQPISTLRKEMITKIERSH